MESPTIVSFDCSVIMAHGTKDRRLSGANVMLKEERDLTEEEEGRAKGVVDRERYYL